jgi:hypothetical protein
MIYCYTKANQMKYHDFTDDVAIVRAINKKSAFNKFKKLYSNITIDDIIKIKVGYKLVTILTDY